MVLADSLCATVRSSPEIRLASSVSDEEPQTLMRNERMLRGGVLMVLCATVAARELYHRQYSVGAAGLAFVLMSALFIAPPPASAARRLAIYACLGIGFAPFVKLLVFG